MGPFSRALASPVRVFIDAGHGGRDAGALGVSRQCEKDLSLRLGKLVRESLKKDIAAGKFDALIKLSRENDYYLTLSERTQLANNWGADVFISLHANSSQFPRAKGFEIYFLNPEASDEAAKNLARLENGNTSRNRNPVESILSDLQTNSHITESSRFAEILFNTMSKSVPGGRAIRQAPFSVLAGTKMPAVLLEVGYLTNLSEARNLERPLYLKKLAGAISLGIKEFLSKEVYYENRRTESRPNPPRSDHT